MTNRKPVHCGKETGEVFMIGPPGENLWVYECEVCKKKWNKDVYDMGNGMFEAF